MKRFFQFSHGEFYATVTLLTLIIVVYSFYFFYHPRSLPATDWSAFQEEIGQFERQQQAYADSLERARGAREAYYQNQRRHYNRHSNRYYARAAETFAKDTTRFVARQRTKAYEIIRIDLNTCDTSDIVRVPQFGSKRAAKIIEYRNKLGGFHSLTQLHEIFILQNIDLAFCEKYFFVDEKQMRGIHINHATYKEMIKHPYFDAYLCKTILQYREKKGKINNILEFQKITHAYPELMDKLTPYLCFD